MDNFAASAPREREEVFRETAARCGLPAAAIEKDFWACWVLRVLFDLPDVGERLMFKGGTSLSKAYNAIQRFSEDIDVSIQPSALGFAGSDDWAGLTRSQRDNRIKALYKRSRELVTDTVIPALDAMLRQRLPGGTWKLTPGDGERDRHEIHFAYPLSLTHSDQLAYVRESVLIELTARAEHAPTERKSISPYVALEFPEILQDGIFEVKVLAAVRTFWEKVTLLHAESSRAPEEAMPPRLARHAYDLCQLMRCGIGDEAFQTVGLLKRVCEHKAAFYPQLRVDYDAAHSGKLHIVPGETRLAELKKDYADMIDFFHVEPPSFDDVMRELQAIQDRVNGQRHE